ncbi:hypothetical protein QN277_024773 [Acacia crassicarpa]|uniref:Transcriptional factor DELLA N-terminal domain-containing protein n=1 Tax=Acacia crassicarpa TaxID=499986 RepID=A0AAE1JEI3_9FABA|nr:hypothetical protein QN277_024773 [Acacia crassicarpa]
MKREHHQLCPNPSDSFMTANSSSKSKLWEDEAQDGDTDELLAILGYKVRSSDMADVAQKLEQLEEAIGNVQGNISQLSSETVHYNPSDLSTWLKSVPSELNPSPNLDSLTTVAGAVSTPPPLPLPPPPPADDSSFLASMESSTIASIDFTDHSQQQHLNPLHKQRDSLT